MRAAWGAYAAAVSLAGGALAVRLAASPYLGDRSPFVVPFLAVLAATWLGGSGPGLLAALIGLIGPILLIFPHQWQPAHWIGILSYVGVSSAAIPWTSWLRRNADALLTASKARRDAEEALQTAADRFRVCVEHTPAAVAMFDRDMNYLAVSNRWLEDHDLAPGLIGRHHYDVLPMAVRWRNNHRQALSGVVQRADEEAYVAPDGSPRWVKWEMHPWRDARGAVGGIIIFTEDITARKLNEAAQFASEERLRLAQAAAGIGIHEYEVTTGTIHWDQRVRELWGLDPDEPVSYESFLSGLHPDDRASTQAAVDRALDPAGDGYYLAEYRVVHRQNGQTRWILATGQVTFTDRQPVRLLGTVQDITERKRVEGALRESEERFRLLADNISQLAWMADSTGEIFWYNQRWFDYTGTTFDEMRGWGWTGVHHPDEVGRVVEKFKQALATGEPWEDTFPLRSQTGEYRWFLSRALPARDVDGRIIRWFGTNTDITRQRELESELREQDRRKDEFLATLAHELRNPLAPVRNAVELMKLAPSNPAAIAESRAAIERQISHMVRLVDDLLDVSRITRNKLELQLEPTELTEIVRQAVDAIRPQFEEVGHRLHLALPGEAIRLQADSVRLTQVFGNLLVNACRYTPAGGDVWVTVRRETHRAEVSVRDSGVGIPAEMLDRIFDLFTQVGHPREMASGGLGIGLSLVKRLVEMHGGTVTAHSAGPGQGTELIVRLSVMALAPADAAPVPGDSKPGSQRRRRVLVVDDNRDAATTLAMLLKVAGHETRVAGDGVEAVEQADAYRPDVILLDVGMPRMNGIEACRAIREQPWGQSMRIIALTGWGQDGDRDASAAAGFDHHLVKPVSAAVLFPLLGAASAAAQR